MSVGAIFLSAALLMVGVSLFAFAGVRILLTHRRSPELTSVVLLWIGIVCLGLSVEISFGMFHPVLSQ